MSVSVPLDRTFKNIDPYLHLSLSFYKLIDINFQSSTILLTCFMLNIKSKEATSLYYILVFNSDFQMYLNFKETTELRQSRMQLIRLQFMIQCRVGVDKS